MKSRLNILSRLQGAGALPFADELLPFAEHATYEALEALSPTRCAGCERAGALICQDCLAALTLIDPRHSCTRCGAPFGDLLCTECSVEGTSSAMAEALDRCLACAVYAHPLPRIIKAYKDAGERRLAPYLAELLYDTALHAQVVAPDRYGG
ncbi:double zinc ribbon domain-containing protein, partial [Collinsella aerofaciens]